MARGGGALVRREDMAIFAVAVLGFGRALNSAEQEGAGAPLDVSWESFRAALSDPVGWARGFFYRLNARILFSLAVVAVGLTVVLRRYFPSLAGIPYGALLGILAAMAMQGQLDGVARALDPSKMLAELVALLRGGAAAPAAALPAPTATTTTSTLECLPRAALCVNRGNVRAYHNRAGSCGAVQCGDGTVWDGKDGRLLSAPQTLVCYRPDSFADYVTGIRRYWTGGPNGCGVVQFNNGATFDLKTRARLAPDYLTRIQSALTPAVFKG